MSSWLQHQISPDTQLNSFLIRQGVKVVDEPDSLKYPMPLPLSITGEGEVAVENVGPFFFFNCMFFLQESGVNLEWISLQLGILLASSQ